MSNDVYNIIKESKLFDEEWFRENYSIGDDVDPIIYFLENCKELNLNPSPDFDTNWYLKQYEDVNKSNMNPFVHYILYGKNEKRLPKPKIHDSKYNDDYSIIINSNLFDEEWFRENYSIGDDVDPIIYFLENCKELNLNPSPDFDTNWYLKQYEDVNKSNLNPFVHYILHGIDEERLPKQDSMRNLTNTIIEIDFNELDTFKKIIDKRFGLIINYKNVKYDLLIHFKSTSKNVFIFGSGVIASDEHSKYNNRPVFKRQSWDLKPEMNESTIFFNDPTRYTYPELLGGWGIGTPDDYYLKNISKIFSKLFSIYGINHENVIFYSSSMGGFMSIQLATMLPGTTAWADIPQTNLVKFENYSNWKKIFDNYDLNDYKHRINCFEFIKQNKYMPKIYLVIDCFSDDLNKQFYPFLDNLENLNQIYSKENLKILINPVNQHQFLTYSQFILLKNKYFNLNNNIKDIEFLSILENNHVKCILKENNNDNISSIIKNIIKSYGLKD